MSFEVDGVFVVAALLVPVGLIVTLVLAPRWLIRSMSKHALWRLRDDLVDDTLSGELPADNAPVQELIRRTEWAIKEARSFDLLHLWVWSRAVRCIPPKDLEELAHIPSLDGLTEEQQALVTDYRLRYNSVAIRAILLSSWLGIGLVVRMVARVLWRALAERTERRDVRVVVRQATDEIASDTSLGRSARSYVTVEGPSRRTLVA